MAESRDMLAVELMGKFHDLLKLGGKKEAIELICTEIAIAEKVCFLSFQEIYVNMPSYRQFAKNLFSGSQTAQQALINLQNQANKDTFILDLANGQWKKIGE